MLGRLSLALAAILIGACNMVLSEAPMFDDSDRGGLAPRNGIWLAEDPDCSFDYLQPESRWPECALWVVVRASGDELSILDGKGEAEQAGGIFAAGDPTIFQVRWVDKAKDDRVYFGFYGVDPVNAGPDGRFSAISMWVVECGVQNKGNSEIQPFPGISPECRPGSKDAIRWAAKLSRRADEAREWRWLRAETPRS